MSIWNLLEDEIEVFRKDSRALPVVPHVTPAQLRAELEAGYTFDVPVPLEEVTAEAMRLLRNYTVHVTHPRYFGLFNPSVRYASIVADLLVALYNPQLAAWSHAPAANEIERLTLRHFARSLGWDPDSTMMNFTSGGMEANLSAVLVALAHHYPGTGNAGLAQLTSRPVIYLTSESHHSFVKIARMTGLGTGCLYQVPTDKDHMMHTEALVQRIKEHKESGQQPFLVVGTAGTTGAGLIDPLEKIAKVAEQYGLWFHVDAAWGGSALLSPKLSSLLTGIEKADSVTWDAHKWLSVPMGAGMFFCRHREAVRRAFAVTTSYMPDEIGESALDPYTTTVQWSRRMIGLKVFMALAEAGSGGYTELIEHQALQGDYLRDRLGDADWMVVNKTQLPVICFSHADIRSGKLSTKQILDRIYARNRVWISDVLLGGEKLVLRACITSYNTEHSDIDCLIDELEYARERTS